MGIILFKEISLRNYLTLGGKLDNINWDYAHFGVHLSSKVVSCVDLGETDSYGEKLVNLIFEDGKTKGLPINHILVTVNVVLDEKHF